MQNFINILNAHFINKEKNEYNKTKKKLKIIRKYYLYLYFQKLTSAAIKKHFLIYLNKIIKPEAAAELKLFIIYNNIKIFIQQSIVEKLLKINNTAIKPYKIF